MGQGPVFLERKSYRRRRLRDALRLLPFLGLLLCMVPLAWPRRMGSAAPAEGAIPTSAALEYLFGIWLLLVIFGWLLWRRTADQPAPPETAQADEPG